MDPAPDRGALVGAGDAPGWARPGCRAWSAPRDAAGKAHTALSPENTSVFAAETRRMALDAARRAAARRGAGARHRPASLVERLAWLRPRRPRTRADQVAWALGEATTLGLVALGGMPSYARALLAGDGRRAALLAPLLPEPVDHVLLQADLTAVAPGPLEPDLARRLQVAAEVESRGGATVYRFTAPSVRRALDLGWTAAELHAFVEAVSRTPVPQPLSYLIDDTARTYGTVRVGHAEAFVRADDEAALTELLAPPAGRLARAAAAGADGAGQHHAARRAAPAPARARRRPRGRGARRLAARRPARRAAGPHAQGARQPGARGPRVAPRWPGSSRRSGPATGPSPSGRPACRPLTPGDSMTALRQAVAARASVLIAYVDNHGASTERIIDPLGLEGGWLTALDHRSEEIRTFAVHRITSVTPVTALDESVHRYSAGVEACRDL